MNKMNIMIFIITISEGLRKGLYWGQRNRKEFAMDDWNRIGTCMQDAGCSDDEIARAETLCRAGAAEELLRCLRLCRSEQLEALHEKQKQLDRLDGLIRRTQNQL